MKCERIPPWILPVLLSLLATLTSPMAAMPQTRFPEPDKLPSRPELPDPLLMLDGERITSKQQWFDKRRPELKALIEHYMYGRAPAAPVKIDATVEREDRRLFGGKATKKEITIAFGPAEVPKIHVLLVIPNNRQKPAPVFVGLNFCGNHALVKDTSVALPSGWMYSHYPGVKDNRATEAGRGTQIDVWALEQSIDRGYAVATCYNGDIAPDDPASRAGVQHHYPPGDARRGPHDWATIAAWAWGVQRVVDHLITDKELDRQRIAVVGHSRLGKTAILAAALDERIALAIPHQAGCGGTAPSRCHNPKAETVKRINTNFPHWFDGAFKEFNDHPDKLPFDQNGLVALVAPRPVLFSNAVEDEWANPSGQFDVLLAADPVYRLLDADGLAAKHMPEPGRLIDSTLGYYIRPGKHSMTKDDWKVFLDFADKHFGKPNAPRP